MPQMAPLNWLTLMFYFMTILLTLNIINYFSFSYNIPFKINHMIKKNQINWKW